MTIYVFPKLNVEILTLNAVLQLGGRTFGKVTAVRP